MNRMHLVVYQASIFFMGILFIGHISENMTDTYIIPDPQRLTDALNAIYKTVPLLGEK